jgi:hypothetical protein
MIQQANAPQIPQQVLACRTVYISGKMTGKPDFGKNDFAHAERVAFNAGAFRVLNPACLSFGWSRKQYMAADLAMLLNCDAVVMLPDWEDSAGARAEWAVAKSVAREIEVFYLEADDTLTQKRKGDQ